MSDEKLMLRAIKLALKGTGKVSPNPRVGAIITKNEKIIGRGWHNKFGAPHAEIEAMRNAGQSDFTGCTMYVTLEPCSHEGKTPACAPEIVERGFEKVVIGCLDENPEVKGKGVEILKNGGVDVTVGILEEECQWINRAFFKYINDGRPYIILKSAQTIDGCISTHSGDSKWITGEESRKRVHILRSEADAVLVGRRTVEVDNPQLTVRHVKGNNPLRVILDSNLSLPLTTMLYGDDYRDNTVVVFSEKNLGSRKAETLRLAKINILPVKSTKNGKVDIHDAVVKLGKEYNVTSILVEGGSSVFSDFINSKIVDEYHIFIASKIVGNGKNAFGEVKTNYIKDAIQANILSVSKSGDDLHIIAKSC